MNLIDAISLGLVQGLTEFLPISSSGHIFLLETWMGMVPDISFELWLHVGSLVAVIVYFWSEIVAMAIGLFVMSRDRTVHSDGIYALKLLTATALTFPTALLTEKLFPHSELSLSLVGVTLLITALLIIVAEKWQCQSRDLSWWVVVILGLVQGIAVLPGISRSGLTIALLIWLGVNRSLSARTSFLLSIPTIAGAAFFMLLEQGPRFYSLVMYEVIAIVVSAISAYFAIFWMMQWIRQSRWIYFAPYCAILGLILLVL